MVDTLHRSPENMLIGGLNIKDLGVLHEVRFTPSKITATRPIALQFSSIPDDYEDTKWQMAESYANKFRDKIFFWKGRNQPVTREEVSNFLAESGDYFLSSSTFANWLLAGIRFVPSSPSMRIEETYFSDINVNAWLDAMRASEKARDEAREAAKKAA